MRIPAIVITSFRPRDRAALAGLSGAVEAAPVPGIQRVDVPLPTLAEPAQVHVPDLRQTLNGLSDSSATEAICSGGGM